MRILLAIVILAAAGWSGYWYIGASGRQGALEGWLEERRAEGWVAEAASISVGGFPNRLDTTATGLNVADPDSGWAWNAEQFQVLSLSYEPTHLIAVWPGGQVLASPYDTIRINGSNIRGSMIFDADASLTLDRSTIELSEVDITGDSGWAARIGQAVLAMRRSQEKPGSSYDINLNAGSLTPPGKWSENISDSEILPKVIESIDLDVVAAFDREWSRASVETDHPALEELEIRDFTAKWGELNLRGKGNLATDDNGYASGEIVLRAKNWQDMIEIARASDAISSGMATAMETGLGLLALLSGDDESLTAQLKFEDGKTWIGPVSIGDAPLLVRRD